MAVYTKIFKDDLLTIEKKFNLGKIISFEGIKNGIENTNYLIKTKKKKFILTIFEKRVQKKELPFFMNLMNNLNNKGINCPKPLKNKDNKYLIILRNKPACVVSFIDGKDKKTLNDKECYIIGKNIAKLHKASKNIRLFRKNLLPGNNLGHLLNSIKFKDKKITANLYDVLKKSLVEIKKEWPRKMPRGIIHADLFIDNIFFKKNKFEGFIDFYFSCNDFFALEIAICFNALCFDGSRDNLSFNATKAKNFMSGYSQLRKLNDSEKKSIKVMSQGSALRFLLTRVFDALNTVEGAIVKVKDPMEYLVRLEFHKNSKNFEDYFF